jgi:hypothetical protein
MFVIVQPPSEQREAIVHNLKHEHAILATAQCGDTGSNIAANYWASCSRRYDSRPIVQWHCVVKDIVAYLSRTAAAQ